MTVKHYFSSFRGKLFFLLCAALLLPLLTVGFLLTAILSKQLNIQFENRLDAGLETLSLILENKQNDLTEGMAWLATDNTLQMTLQLEIAPQLSHYLATQVDVLKLSGLTIFNPERKIVAKEGIPHPACPFTEQTSLFITDQVLLCETIPITRDDTFLGFAQGTINLSDQMFADYLSEKMVDNFILWADERMVVTDLDLGEQAVVDLPLIDDRMGGLALNSRNYKIKVKQLDLGDHTVTYGLLLPLTELRGDAWRIIFIIGLAVVFFFIGTILLLQRSARDLINPVTALTNAAAAIKINAEQVPKLDYERRDEFGALNRTFRDMHQSLNNYIKDIQNKNLTLRQFNERIEKQNKELRELHETLEKRVEERTRDLLESTQELKRQIAERERAEAELLHSEQRLHQAQKMESIGRLAGGVAHDFNNILTGVKGYVQLILGSLDATDPIRAEAVEIKNAADRAAQLTQQLLAFSRKQVIVPKVIHLPKVVRNSEKMLGRIIGEDIKLHIEISDDLWPILADPGQIDQILINLAANARDAVPHGGELSIKAVNIDTREHLDPDHPDIRPGQHVALIVRDNGSGMDEQTRQHIFEPFFSTKSQGKGTGLGLATVYGIVKQNHGYIYVYSTQGEGTTFAIYFPRVKDTKSIVAAEPLRHEPVDSNGAETILIAEDEHMVRNLSRKVLENYGYKVLVAEDGQIALAKSMQYRERIDLLLTDVVMPNMNGKDLYDTMLEQRPDIKVLFMSGYTDDVIAKHGVLEGGTPFIQKPFSIEALAAKVREVLN